VTGRPPIFPDLECDANGASDLTEMTAVILAGGKGTRLAPYTSVLPKPLMPLGGNAILEIVVGQLERAQFRRIVLCVGYLAHLIVAVLQNGSERAAHIDYVKEEVELGTAGSLRLASGLDQTFLVLNGDVLTDLDLQQLVAHHAEQKNILTIAAHQRIQRADYGVLRLGDEDKLLGYDEKPEELFHVSMGVYVMEPAALAYIPEGRFDFPELVHALLAAGEPVGVYPYGGLWLDIGRHEDYERAVALWEEHDPFLALTRQE
jgi:NDP-sugar pyrophosphorylase family protein